ncbi:GTP-binding protein OBGC, chloroplastic [Trifolium repens]|nr:Transducin/WD40 repeat superfamily protein [Trifolium repens]KAK2386637.1 GTP-binding protein OBGC, chloroplastic [Trifolium repens]
MEPPLADSLVTTKMFSPQLSRSTTVRSCMLLVTARLSCGTLSVNANTPFKTVMLIPIGCAVFDSALALFDQQSSLLHGTVVEPDRLTASVLNLHLTLRRFAVLLELDCSGMLIRRKGSKMSLRLVVCLSLVKLGVKEGDKVIVG